MKKEIYLDNSASTRICDEALEKYVEVSRNTYGNPSSLHAVGLAAEMELKRARQIVLGTVGGSNYEVLFTSSGTEANNLAILGRAFAKERYKKGAKIITTAGEHASVSEPFRMLEGLGYKVVYIPTRGGVIDTSELERELDASVILVSVMMVNNETGAVYDLPRVAKTVRSRSPEALIHVDATQGYMKIPFTMRGIGADAVTLSSHKIEGPKGVGALVVDKSVLTKRGLSPVIYGGGQESGLRSGTENVPGIAAFGEAARVASEKLNERIEKTSMLRSLLIERLSEDSLSSVKPTLPPMYAPHILNITLPEIKSETMLHFLSERGIYVSSGSACSSNGGHKATALTAYGHTYGEADTSIRVSFSHRNTPDDVHALADALIEGLSRLARIKR